MPALETAAVATSVGTHAVSTITAAGASVASAIRALGKVVARTCRSAYGRGIGLIALKMRRWSSRCVTILWVLRWELTVFVLAAGDDETRSLKLTSGVRIAAVHPSFLCCHRMATGLGAYHGTTSSAYHGLRIVFPDYSGPSRGTGRYILHGSYLVPTY